MTRRQHVPIIFFFHEFLQFLPPSVLDLPSPLILYGVYVLISLALGEYGAVDRSTDPKGKLQPTVFQCGSRQPRNGVREEALLKL
jgi:hypothetical protein